jgi:hypothetical protein
LSRILRDNMIRLLQGFAGIQQPRDELEVADRTVVALEILVPILLGRNSD